MRMRPGLALPLSLLLVACSDSNDDDAVAGSYLIGGMLCNDGDLQPVDLNNPLGPDGSTEDNGAVVLNPESDTPQPEDALRCGLPLTDLPSSNLTPTGSGTVMFDDREYVLNSAIRIEPGVPEGPEVDMLLHGGETRVLERSEIRPMGNGFQNVDRIDYGAYDSTAALSLLLIQAGSERDPSGRTYNVMPESEAIDDRGEAVNGDAVIDTFLIVDLDGDGVPSIEEAFRPTSGQVIWSGTASAPSLTFNFVLEDGRAIEGSYEGGYEFLELPEPLTPPTIKAQHVPGVSDGPLAEFDF